MMHGALHQAVLPNTARVVFRAVLFLLAASASPLRAEIDVLNPPGEMVDIGGYRLHIDCRGEGTPTVIMEAGLGGTSLEWLPAQRFLSHYGHVCTYDRAGNGWSDAGPLPRTTSIIVDELYALLHKADVPGPYILVGHSYGGYTAQLFAERYPYLTAGLVLVDSSHPDQVARFLAPPLQMNTAPSREATGVMLMSGPPVLPAHMPEETQIPAMMLMALRKSREAVAQEYLYFRDSGEEVLSRGRLPDVPLVVISRGVAERAADDPRTPLIESLWMQLQDELAAMSPRSAHIVAERSGHHIHLDQPQLIVDAVAMVVDFARTSHRDLHAGAAGSTWLAFEGASWRSDNLHRGSEPFPPLPDAIQLVTALSAGAGHLAWTRNPRSQRFSYPPDFQSGIHHVSFVQ